MGNIWRNGLILGIFFSSLFGEGVIHSVADPVVGDTALETLSRICPTPEALVQFFQQQMTFEEDIRLFSEVDYWQTPEEFLARRAGDCEDYALLAEAVLRNLRMEAFVFSLYGEGGYAHTVCVFVEEGRYHVINQDRLLRLKAKTLEELAEALYARWTWGAVAERAGARGRGIRFIENEVLRTRTLSTNA